jgi:hypothetical protein
MKWLPWSIPIDTAASAHGLEWWVVRLSWRNEWDLMMNQNNGGEDLH